jgi:1,4-dihydroxy-2-naphthoate octaprenyltransferase
MHSMTPWQRWRYAAKPMSWPKLLVPCVLGQAIGFASSSTFSWRGAGLGVAFTILDLLYIVFLNDWGDREVDALKRKLFPNDCSPKTIPDGILPGWELLRVGLIAGAVAIALSWVAQVWLSLPWAGVMGTISILIFWTYTFPPLRLNYRGGGELLEMIGVGVMLPWFNAYLQSGRLFSKYTVLLFGFTCLSLASAIASGLSDEVSDRRGGKRTVVTAFGNLVGRRFVEFFILCALPLWVVFSWLAGVSAIFVLPPTAVVLWYFVQLRLQSDKATSTAFREQARYKGKLHAAIWLSSSLMAGLLFLWGRTR